MAVVFRNVMVFLTLDLSNRLFHVNTRLFTFWSYSEERVDINQSVSVYQFIRWYKHKTKSLKWYYAPKLQRIGNTPPPSSRYGDSFKITIKHWWSPDSKVKIVVKFYILAIYRRVIWYPRYPYICMFTTTLLNLSSRFSRNSEASASCSWKIKHAKLITVYVVPCTQETFLQYLRLFRGCLRTEMRIMLHYM